MPNPLAQILQRALPRTDSAGRFLASDARELRSLVREAESGGSPGALFPEDLLGPWVDLPPHVQTYLRTLAEGEIRQTMAFHPRGRIWPGLARAAGWVRETASERGGEPWLEEAADLWEVRIWHRPRMTRGAVLARIRARRWRRASQPRISDLLSALGMTAQWLMAGFTEGVRVDSRCRGFFHDPERNVVYGYCLGLDVAPTPSGVVCFESNLDAGLTGQMREPYFDRDPIPPGLADLAHEHGLRRVIWVAPDQLHIDPWFYVQLWEGLAAEGIDLQVLEDVRIPKRRDVPEGLPVPPRILFPPERPPRDSLVVRIRSYEIGPDVVVDNKTAFAQALGPELARSGDTRVRVLPLSPEPGDVSLPQDPGVPNLVYKYPRMDLGEGVFFLRARDKEHALALARELDRATDTKGGLFQPWVSSRMLPGRLIYEFRSFVLVTPVGTRYLGARRRDTVTPIPERLEEGIVKDRKPFINTGFFGNVSGKTDPAEEPAIKDGSLGVADGLARVLTRGFVIRP
ncbi:hypothetical protein ACFL3S_06970 [Gemmatimonadota bacterium]